MIFRPTNAPSKKTVPNANHFGNTYAVVQNPITQVPATPLVSHGLPSFKGTLTQAAWDGSQYESEHCQSWA
jgi:hypothetical protein